MATSKKTKRSVKRPRPDRPGHVGDVRILQSSRTRGQDIRVGRHSRRPER